MNNPTYTPYSILQTPDPPSPLITVVGETASGKSGVAMEIARRFDGEIINADSWQIYKGMDVGTAKPSEREREEIPHHLIDIVEPDEEFTPLELLRLYPQQNARKIKQYEQGLCDNSTVQTGFTAAVYKRMAVEAIGEISSRGKLPILVGGTGLYIDGVLFDYSFAPPGESGQRETLQQKTIPELLEIIQRKDLDTTGIDTRNKRRLIRLLETGGTKPEQSPLRPNTLVLGVSISRAMLRENIEKRTEVMFRAGLKHEVRELAEQYGWGVEAMKGIGYREFKPYFEGEQSLAETKRKITKSTLELAKKQRTWFKRNRHIQWVESTEGSKKLANNFLNA